MMKIAFIFLQAGTGPTDLLTQFGPLVLMFAVVWFFFMRPQAKKQREQEDFTKNLEKGDEIVTNSGILGRINKVDGNIVTVEVGNKTYIRFTRNAISKELTDAIAAAPDTKDDDKE